jgi:hypothetical protein
MNKLLYNICCAFIVKKKNRKHFREKYKNRSIFEAIFLSNEIINSLNREREERKEREKREKEKENKENDYFRKIEKLLEKQVTLADIEKIRGGGGGIWNHIRILNKPKQFL